MTSDISGHRHSEAHSGGLPATHYALLGAVCALVIGVYAWSAKSGWLELGGSGEANVYYNLLVQSFCSGRLALMKQAPPGLRPLAGNPDSKADSSYRADQNPLTDVSYYKGKLYLYFGVVPAMLLFWPYRELTGHYVSHQDAVVFFFSAGFLAGAGLLWGVWRRYFPGVGLAVALASTLAMGLANFALACLPRGSVYEAAISCGYALTMTTLLLLWRTMHAPQGRGWWLAGASLACGLVVGARPSLVFGAVILLLPVVRAWRASTHYRESGRQPSGSWLRTSGGWKALVEAAAPLAFIGLGLSLYNFLRFHDPFEFGEHHMLSWTGHESFQPQYGVPLFSLRYLWFNLQVYFLELARWSGRFPFVHDGWVPDIPKGYRLLEHPFGIASNVPLVWLTLAVPLIARAWRQERYSALRWFTMTLTLLFGSCALAVCLFISACTRYQAEFLPTLVMLAVMSAFALEQALARRRVWRLAARWGSAVLLVFSVSFNGCAMIMLASYRHTTQGVVSFREGRTDEAVAQLQKALALQTDNPEAHSNLGLVLIHQGKVPEGIRHLEAAVRLKPDFAEAHYHLGEALLQLDEAAARPGTGLVFATLGAEAQNDLGEAWFRRGKLLEAIEHYRLALQIRPNDARAHYNLGFAFFHQGKVTEGIEHYEIALQFQPQWVEVHDNLACALFQAGKVPEAIAHWQQALRLKRDFGEAHYNLGTALLLLGRTPEAVGHLEQAVRLKPDFAGAQSKLAWVLATCKDESMRNGARAVELAEGPNKLAGGKDPAILDTLAAAYAEAGRFEEAVRAAQTAIDLLEASGPGAQIQPVQTRLKLYQAGRPYRQE